MRLADGLRQVVAAGLASAVFLALFFGLKLVWWLSFGLGALIYGAALLVIKRKSPLSEVRLASRVTAADVAQAAARLQDASTRLQSASESAPETERRALAQMADHLRSIRQSVMEDPDDLRAARQFINVYLPKIVQTVESYIKVTGLATQDSAARLRNLGQNIQSFEPVVHRIREACIENDLVALELEVDVLSRTLDHK